MISTMKYLAGGAATLSKNSNRFTKFTPEYLVKGNGCFVEGSDGATYIDMIGALGANLLGYNNPLVVRAVMNEVLYGGSFSLMHRLEPMLAERIVNLIPNAEKVRFAKNGADVTQAAVRLARWYTKKAGVFCTGYHGMHDWYVITTPKNAGVLFENSLYTHPLNFLDITPEYLEANLYKHSNNIAAMIVEVPPIDFSVQHDPCEQILRDISKFCRANNIVFILDEIVTGFRYAIKGAQNYYNIPNVDLICLGKGIANGYPLSIICGKNEIMAGFDDRVFLSTTFGGETIGLSAANAVLDYIESKDSDYLFRIGLSIGNALYEDINSRDLPIKLLGNHARYIMQFKNTEQCSGEELKTVWLAQTALNKILFGGPIFPQYCMDRAILKDIIIRINESMELLEDVFKRGNVKSFILNNDIVVPEDVFAKRY